MMTSLQFLCGLLNDAIKRKNNGVGWWDNVGVVVAHPGHALSACFSTRHCYDDQIKDDKMGGDAACMGDKKCLYNFFPE
jgi:hypothetical protein